MNQIDLTKPTKKPMTYSQLKDKKPSPPSPVDSFSDDSSSSEDNKKRKVLGGARANSAHSARAARRRTGNIFFPFIPATITYPKPRVEVS